jgi:hypothetical protein
MSCTYFRKAALAVGGIVLSILLTAMVEGRTNMGTPGAFPATCWWRVQLGLGTWRCLGRGFYFLLCGAVGGLLDIYQDLWSEGK